MLSKVLKLGAIGAVSLVFVACSPFVGTELTNEGKLMSFSQSKPMGCMLVGEKQGKATKTWKIKATAQQFKDSAINDMINNAAFLQQVGAKKDGTTKRLVVYSAREEWGCDEHGTPCKERVPDIDDVKTLTIYGEIYECNF